MTEYTEGYPYVGTFVKSPLDGVVYCRKNGDFFRHLVSNGIESYSGLIEALHPDKVRYCKCGTVCSITKATMQYKSCCGSPDCTIDARRDGLRNRPEEKKQAHLAAIRKSLDALPDETKLEIIEKRKHTGYSRGSYQASVAKREETCDMRHGDKKYNNRSKISETKLNWTPEQKAQFLERLRATLDGKWLNDFATADTWQRRRERLEAAGRMIPLELLTDYQRYRRKVDNLTRKVYNEHVATINPNGLVRGNTGDCYHLDHIMPVAYGFVNNLPIDEVACVSNLQMLPWRENFSKGKKYDAQHSEGAPHE